MPKQIKVDLVAELNLDVQKSSALLLTDYRGLKVGETQQLRRKIREAGAEYKVVKNTLLNLAVGENTDAKFAEMLAGPTAVTFVPNDPVAAAKAIMDFTKDHKGMVVKGGLVDGRVYDAAQILALSKIPPRDVLIAQLLGSIQAPIAGLVGTLQGTISNLVFTLQAVVDQKAA